MIPTSRRLFLMLQVGLMLSAFGWGIAFYFAFVPWDAAAEALNGMGARPIAYQPMLDYWLKMASVAFGCIGLGSAIACARPQRFAGLIYLLGPFHFIVGTTLIVAASRNHLQFALHPTFIPDIVFCFTVGAVIQLPLLYARKTAQKTSA